MNEFGRWIRRQEQLPVEDVRAPPTFHSEMPMIEEMAYFYHHCDYSHHLITILNNTSF